MDVTLPHVLFKYISIFHSYLKLFCLVGNYFQWGKKRYKDIFQTVYSISLDMQRF